MPSDSPSRALRVLILINLTNHLSGPMPLYCRLVQENTLVQHNGQASYCVIEGPDILLYRNKGVLLFNRMACHVIFGPPEIFVPPEQIFQHFT